MAFGTVVSNSGGQGFLLRIVTLDSNMGAFNVGQIVRFVSSNETHIGNIYSISFDETVIHIGEIGTSASGTVNDTGNQINDIIFGDYPEQASSAVSVWIDPTASPGWTKNSSPVLNGSPANQNYTTGATSGSGSLLFALAIDKDGHAGADFIGQPTQ